MTEQNNADRWREIRAVHKENANFYRMLRGGVIIGLFVFIGWSVFQESDEPRAFGMNLWTEIAGIAVTVLIIDLLNEMRSERRYKRQLVDQAASTNNEIAKNAVHQIRRKGWLVGEISLLRSENLAKASLQNVDLSWANLRGGILVRSRLDKAKLTGVDLRRGADLHGASLKSADLRFAKMQKSNLCSTTLIDADMSIIELQGARLRDANLENARMIGAKLQGADLHSANLEGVDFARAEFDQSTILPDGTRWKSYKETDMHIFTDRNHADFWRSPDPTSPAYKANSWKT
jgi:uncharacterized protein YjbI with pentapeptide repeats